MNSILSSLIGSLPVGSIIIIGIVVTYVKVRGCERRIERLENLFINHLKNPVKKGGDKDV